MITTDTSVLVAGFCTWHEFHGRANEIVGRDVPLLAPCAAECFSVLTRLPSPHRIGPSDAAAWLRGRFPGPWLALSSGGYQDLVAKAARLGIVGGALYDGIVAVTAQEHDLTLTSFDKRAQATYRALGIDFRVG